MQYSNINMFRVIKEKLHDKIDISPDSHLPCNIYIGIARFMGWSANVIKSQANARKKNEYIKIQRTPPNPQHCNVGNAGGLYRTDRDIKLDAVER